MFSFLFFVALLAYWILGIIGLKLLSEWKENISTFLTAFATILAVAVIDIAVIPFLTPETASWVILANVVAFIVMIVGVVYFWKSRYPKFNLKQAKVYILEFLRPKFPDARIDEKRPAYLDGRLYHVWSGPRVLRTLFGLFFVWFHDSFLVTVILARYSYGVRYPKAEWIRCWL